MGDHNAAVAARKLKLKQITSLSGMLNSLYIQLTM